MDNYNWSYFILICIGLVLTFGQWGCSPSSEEQAKDAASEVEAREIAFAKTMEDRDFEAFLSFVSPEAVQREQTSKRP